MWNVANFMKMKFEFFRGMLLNGDPGGFIFFEIKITSGKLQLMKDGFSLADSKL